MPNTTPTINHFSPGPAPGCPQCPATADAEPDVDDGYFAWAGCEACDDPLGGMRYAAHVVYSNHSYEHMNVCADCILAMDGQDPDNRMPAMYARYQLSV